MQSSQMTLTAARKVRKAQKHTIKTRETVKTMKNSAIELGNV